MGQNRETMMRTRKTDSRTMSGSDLKKDYRCKTEVSPRHRREESVEKKKVMDHWRRMQSWAIVKRFIQGRDGWAFEKPLVGDDATAALKLKEEEKKTILGLPDIENRLNKGFYSDHFAHDLRIVFSLALQYCHPRSETHKVARR